MKVSDLFHFFSKDKPVVNTLTPTINKESPMAVTSLFSDLKSDFKKIENLFVLFFKKVPSFLQVAETDLAFVAPVINTIVTLLEGPTVDAEVAQVIATVQNDLVLATKFVQAADTSANLSDVLNSIIANLQGLLTLAGVKNSTSVSQVTAYVTGIVGEIQAILAALPQAPAAAVKQ
jgi:hypothetical protein